MSAWERIRSRHTNRECLDNGSWALQNSSQLDAADHSVASGAFTLLPTAGALIGAPTRKMWIVYKLIPVADILRMFLS